MSDQPGIKPFVDALLDHEGIAAFDDDPFEEPPFLIDRSVE
jgi:hypothetical protein